jgi:4-amino-4-deoxy-L-arabinose transferase-like glycosyltransferase
MQSAARIAAMADVIRLSLAPVFLITGVASLLAVLANRLGRIIDRARRLEHELREANAAEIARLHDELNVLSRRASLVYVAITLGVVCALLVCVVIATVFASLLLHVNITSIVAILFIAAMLVLIGALITFLREVFLATASLRIGPL